MRSKQSKRRNYISGKKKKRVNKRNMPSNIGNETPNIENELQLTLHNAAYKMTVSRVEEWYNLLNIRYYKHLFETYHIHWVSTRDKSNATLLEMKIKLQSYLPINKKYKQKNKKMPSILMTQYYPEAK